MMVWCGWWWWWWWWWKQGSKCISKSSWRSPINVCSTNGQLHSLWWWSGKAGSHCCQMKNGYECICFAHLERTMTRFLNFHWWWFLWKYDVGMMLWWWWWCTMMMMMMTIVSLSSSFLERIGNLWSTLRAILEKHRNKFFPKQHFHLFTSRLRELLKSIP